MNFLKSSLAVCVASVLVGVMPAAAQQAATFPTKPVNIVTAFAAGSGPDAVLRQVSDKLSKLWSPPVTITAVVGIFTPVSVTV